MKPAHRKVLWITFFLLLYTNLLTILIYFYLGMNVGLENIDTINPSYRLEIELATATVFSIVFGSLFGGLEAFYFSRKFKQRSYAIAVKAFIYSSIAAVIAFTSSVFYNSVLLEMPFYSTQVLNRASNYAASSGGLYTFFLVLSAIVAMIFPLKLDCLLLPMWLKKTMRRKINYYNFYRSS